VNPIASAARDEKDLERAAGLQADVVALSDLPEVDALAPGKRMAHGEQGDELIFPVRKHLEAGRRRQAREDADVGDAVEGRLQNVRAGLLAEDHPDLRIEVYEGRDLGRQVLRDGRRVGMDAHLAPGAAGERAELDRHLVDAFEDPLRVPGQRLPRGRSRHPRG
jgi:hypothetical protein